MKRSLTALTLTVLILSFGACGDDDDNASSKAAPSTTTSETTRPATTPPTTTSIGHDVFVASCARCHGHDAEGELGPPLAGGAAERAFPNIDDQIDFVEGHTLPPFSEQLREEEIRAVVEYTRSLD